MIFSEKSRIEEYVIEILDRGPLLGPALIETIQNEKTGAVTGAIYLVLRKLIKNEVINKTKKLYSLNRYWIQKVHEFTRRHIESEKVLDIINIFDFEDGDKITYEFKSPYLMDIYWGHLYDALYEIHPHDEPVLNFHPHEWLIHARPETEKFFLNRFIKDKKTILFSIGGNTAIDKQFKKEWSSAYIKINTGINYGLKKNQYLSVIGDFIFEISTTAGFSEAVDTIFKKHTHITVAEQKSLQDITQQKHRSKLVFSRNKKKADMWRKNFKKDFYIPQ